MFTVKQIYCTKHFLFYTKHCYKIKAICLNKVCPKFEVEITKMEAPMRFYLGAIPKIATGCHLHSIECFFDLFSCNKLIYFCHNITSITKQLCISDLSGNMCFVKIRPSFDYKIVKILFQSPLGEKSHSIIVFFYSRPTVSMVMQFPFS